MSQSPTGTSQIHTAPKVSRLEVAMCAVENIPGGGATVETWFHAKDICIQGSGKEFHRRESKDGGGGGQGPPEAGRAWRQAESGCLSLLSEASLITSGIEVARAGHTGP